MYKKIRLKLTTVATLIIFLFILFLVGLINVINFQQLVDEADEKIKEIMIRDFTDINNNFVSGLPFENTTGEPPIKKPHSDFFETHYFGILISDIHDVDTYQVISNSIITNDEAIQYGKEIINNNKIKGFYESFRYRVEEENEYIKIVFLDCSRTLTIYNEFVISSILLLLFGLIFIFTILLLFSKRMIKPFEDNYNRQRKFITNASHEIKTPLTIINANVDILEMEYGSNESTSDIYKQIDHLKNLINQLIVLSKTEEDYNNITMSSIPLSDIVNEEIVSFTKYASASGKQIVAKIEPMLSINGNDKLIRQLTGILLDNAIKYSPAQSIIDVELFKQNHNVIYTVQNNTIHEINKKDLNEIFDRFYRIDESHNSNINGFGIGLSIAKAITLSHNAKISANYINNQFVITITFNNKKDN